MSYIIEALKKMEQDKERAKRKDSWLHENDIPIAAGSGQSTPKGRWLIIGSLAIGLIGFAGGVMLWLDARADRTRLQAISTQPVRPPASKSAKMTPPSAPPILPASPSVSDPAIQARPPATPLPASEAAPITPIETPVSENGALAGLESAPSGALKRNAPAGQASIMPAKIDADPPTSRTNGTSSIAARPAIAPKTAKTEPIPIDLTAQYRLTSTGDDGGRPYATINGKMCYEGDLFMGMRVSKVETDRVFLVDKTGRRRYQIVFRYK